MAFSGFWLFKAANPSPWGSYWYLWMLLTPVGFPQKQLIPFGDSFNPQLFVKSSQSPVCCPVKWPLRSKPVLLSYFYRKGFLSSMSVFDAECFSAFRAFTAFSLECPHMVRGMSYRFSQSASTGFLQNFQGGLFPHSAKTSYKWLFPLRNLTGGVSSVNSLRLTKECVIAKDAPHFLPICRLLTF